MSEFGFLTKLSSAMQGKHTMRCKLPSREPEVPKLRIQPPSISTPIHFQEEEMHGGPDAESPEQQLQTPTTTYEYSN